MAAQYLAAQGIDIDAELSKVQFGQAGLGTATGPSSMSPLKLRPFRRIDTILGASLPNTPRGSLWDVSTLAGLVHSATPHDPAKLQAWRNEPSSTTVNAHGALLAPALCHPHLHLDKPYLLTHPKHSHLQIKRGDFAEAMELTNEAKKNFEKDDLLERGQRVIDESVTYGATSMRAFVEVDPTVHMKCLDAAIALREKAKDRCEVQICVFAQLALFSTHDDGGEKMRSLVQMAAERPEVDVVGSTPYVETSRDVMEKNVEWAVDLALSSKKHLDFHLDYNLDPDTEPLVWFVLKTLKDRKWTENSDKTIVLGHCTRLCLFRNDEWERLGREIGDLPISFVGLPTSDLFMMRTENQTRGTLPVTKLIQDHHINAAIGINNVGNAFTPQGCCDPLSLASMGVGVYQAGTVKDAEVLYECISTRARAAIGLVERAKHGRSAKDAGKSKGVASPSSLVVSEGQPANLLLFGNEEPAWRTRTSVSEAVYLYDGVRGRRSIMGGVLVD